MRCFYHKDRKATKSCGNCGRFICDDDAVELEGGTWCKHCLEELVANRKTTKKEVKTKEEKPAGLVSRTIAWGVDLGICVPVFTIIYGVLSGFRGSPIPEAIIFSFVGTLFYDLAFVAFFGKTIGKLIMGVEVVRDEKKPGFARSALRSVTKIPLLFMIPLLPFSLGFAGVIMSVFMALTEAGMVLLTKKAPHDYIAGTKVIH